MSEVIFTTVHGSHLYGLNGPNSDLDTYTVTTSRNRARQKIKGVEDTTVIGWDMFLTYAFTGSHQSVEALFSPVKVWHSRPELAPMLRPSSPSTNAPSKRSLTPTTTSADVTPAASG